MILQSLHALYGRLENSPRYELPAFGYSAQNIAFKVVLHPDGTLFEIQPVDKKLNVPGGDKPTGKVTAKSVHGKVSLLRNDLPFLVGIEVEETKDKKAEPKLNLAEMEFRAFRQFHLNLRDKIQDPAFAAVCAFLESWSPADALGRKEWAAFGAGQGVFQIIGEMEYVHQKTAVREWWETAGVLVGEPKPFVAECLITGKAGVIAQLHEPKIKSLPKPAQSSGAPIVSFDMDSEAYCSYGMNRMQGYNAPVSRDAAFRYATMLNNLLDGPQSKKHRFQLAETTIVFWTDACADNQNTITEDVFAEFAKYGEKGFTVEETQDETLRQRLEIFLKALRSGQDRTAGLIEEASANFFMLGLTGQAVGRIGVRFIQRGSIREFVENLRKHYEDMRVIRMCDDASKFPDPEFPRLQQLLEQTCPPKKKKPDAEKIPPLLAGPLLRAVLTGSFYPDGLYSGVIRRIRAEREINYLRACVIKGYLVRNQRKEITMSVDEKRTDPAYRLGRLFAVLEKIQEDAFREQTGRYLEKGIRDTFFGSACATPASVFPRLERLSTHHRRQLPGWKKHIFDEEIADIKAEMNRTPSVLSLIEQGEFILGYYHQWKKLRTKKEEQEPIKPEIAEEK